MSNPYVVYPNFNQGYQQNKFYNQPYNQNIYPPQPPPIPPTPPNYSQGPSTPSNVIVVTNQNTGQIAGGMPMGGGGFFCPVCLMITGSYVTRGYGTLAASWALILCCFTCFLCWVPYVMDSCKQQQIRCINCNTIKRTL